MLKYKLNTSENQRVTYLLQNDDITIEYLLSVNFERLIGSGRAGSGQGSVLYYYYAS